MSGWPTPVILAYRVGMEARAWISLTATSDGGLAEPLSSPCQSLLLGIGGDSHDGDLFLGVEITTTSDEALVPSSEDILVDLHLASELADGQLAPGAAFTITDPIRVVGCGRLVDVLPS